MDLKRFPFAPVLLAEGSQARDQRFEVVAAGLQPAVAEPGGAPQGRFAVPANV